MAAERRLLRLAGRDVLRVGFGAARWSLADPEDDAPAERIVEAALAAGVGHLDTARAYTTSTQESHNERLLARVLARTGRGDDVLVATKGGHYRDGDRFPIDGSPAALRADCERSLSALGRDRIDLYYLHFPDPDVPFAASVQALAQLREEGLVGEVGLSNISTEQLLEALDLVPVAALQNPMSPYARPDAEQLALAAEHEVAVLAYSPLGGTTPPVPAVDLSAAARRIAAEREVEVATVLLAWLLGQGDHVGIVTGARRPASLAASVLAADLVLDPAELAAIGADLAVHWAQAGED